MKIFKIKTEINAPFDKVWNGFGEKLFNALQPSFPATEVLRFDGCNIGDVVETNIKFFGIKQPFYAVIIDNAVNAQQACFTDIGTKLPFFLKAWQHKHIISSAGENTSIITDEIHFASWNKVAEAFLLPVIYGQLYMRKPVYRKFFQQ